MPIARRTALLSGFNLLLGGGVAMLTTACSRAGAATAALPALARYRVEMQGLGRNGDADVMALIQSAELRGAVLKPDGKGGEEFDAKAFNQFMRNSEMVSGMTGGRYGMTDVGQFLRSAGAWQQLGIPSAFCMTPADVRWIYRLADRVVEVRVWCSAALAASFLDVRLLEGTPPEGWLVAHTLALGPNEMDQGGEVRVHAADLWAACIPAADSLMALRLPGTCYAVAPAEPCQAPEMGLLDKRSVKMEAVQDFQWSPSEPLLAAYTIEQGNLPARIVLVKVRSESGSGSR